jgi:hypothetical protein
MTQDGEKITEAANPEFRWLQSYNHSHGALILRDYVVQNLPGGGLACEHCLKEGLLRPLTDEERGAYYGTGWPAGWHEAAGYQALVITVPQHSGIRIAAPDDGPLPPNLLYWRGCPHRLSRQRTWQVLNAIWISSDDEFVKEASFRQLSRLVWARDDVDDGVIRGHLSKLSKWLMNEQLPLEVSGSRQTARVSIIDHQ